MSCAAYLVVGVRLSDVYTTTETTEEVTKYDPDTGKPYTKKITKKEKLWFGQRPPSDEVPGEWSSKQLGGLEVFHTGEDHTDEESVLGLKIAECDDLYAHGGFVRIDLHDISTIKAKIHCILWGKWKSSNDPCLFLVGYSSC